MKKIIISSILCMLVGLSFAQGPQGQRQGLPGQKPRQAQRKFQILIKNENKPQVIQASNDRLAVLQDEARSMTERGILGDLLWTGYTSAITQKTVNASSNLLSLGINYLTEAFKSDRDKWYRTAQQQCYYSQPLSSESNVSDFYALPSTKGAMDPENLLFDGFGCRNYIEVMDSPGDGTGVFYIYCKMRRDDEGLKHIVNHSKFLVEIDTLIVVPKYCNLPNDSTGSADSRFDFDKRNDLNLSLKVRLYSSWMNQATMITNDQQLGEFTISAQIDKSKINSEGQFIYKKGDPDFERLVSVEGDCFIVPRSFTGTMDAKNYQPSWGTGQYRIEMEVSESCRIVDSYYQIRESGNGREVAFADGTPGKKKWDKAKWKTEWNSMNSRKKGDAFLRNAWQCITKAYKGSGWMATLTDPFTTALYSYETTKLGEAFDNLHDSWFSDNSGSVAAPAASGSVPSITTGGGGQPQGGGTPAGNGAPKGNGPDGGQGQKPM